MTVGLRRARPDDVAFLVELANDPDVSPFLSARAARDRPAIAAEVERSAREPRSFGRLVIEAGRERAGGVRYERVNERSRIAHLGALALHPRFRGRGLGVAAARALQRHLVFGLGFHRLELEIYAFNERALAHAERAGWVREGRKRLAYLRDGRWVDSVLYAVVEEDLR